jgi:AbrB family looped-hinge helix DNA binding protein
MKALTLSSKNQVVIPKAVRGRLKITSGDKLIIQELTNDYVLLKKEPTYYDLLGIVKPQKTDPVDRIRALRDNWR